MSIAEKMTAQLEEKTAAELGVPVLGIATVNVVGTLGYIASNTVGDIVGDLAVGHPVAVRGRPKDRLRRGDGTSTKLPVAFALAVTADHLVVFDVRFGPFAKVKLKGELGRFDRAGLQLEVGEDKVVTTYHVYSPSQDQDMQFEMMGGSAAGGEHTRKLADLIRGT
jgi:hypothetical protein